MAVAVLRQVNEDGKRAGAHLHLWCPGCDDLHLISVRGDDGSRPKVEWTWDGNLEAPTVTPSIKVGGVQWPKASPFYKPQHRARAKQPICCHSHLTAGVWNFLADCTHALRGNVPMVELPEDDE